MSPAPSNLKILVPAIGVFFLVICNGDDKPSGPVGNGVPPGGTLTTRTFPAPGNPAGTWVIPAEAGLEDVSAPRTIVGTGTPESCTPEALEHAVHQGGIVTFNGGPDPVTLTLDHEIRIYNDSGPGSNGDVIIDGGGKITLSGGERCRILFQNGCDSTLHWITPRCDSFPHPRLVVQNLIFADGRTDNPGFGGGAIYIQSGILKVVNCVFVNNRCASTGPDVGGGAIYAFLQAGPVYIVNSTFGGDSTLGNSGSNGGALGSIGVSYSVINCVLSWNKAVGWGMNPKQNGTPGGGSGGAIYNDGNTYTLSLCGCDVSHNTANELAGAVFFVSNDTTGSFFIDQSTVQNNAAGRYFKNFFVIALDSAFTNSTID
jgi:hypothetical protein